MTNPRLGERGGSAGRVGAAEHLRHTEVEHLQRQRRLEAPIGDEDVVRLDVPMDDAVLVRAVERASDLPHERLRGGEAEATAASRSSASEKPRRSSITMNGIVRPRSRSP